MSEQKFYVAVFLLSLGVRLAFDPAIATGAPSVQALVNDEEGYWALGQNLATTGKYLTPPSGLGYMFMQGGQPGDRTAFRPPVYPAFLAAHYWVFGDNRQYPRLTQLLLDSLSACWIGLLGRRLFSASAGRIAALAWALWPPAIFYSTVLFSESLTVDVTILVLLATWWSYTRPTILSILTAGLVMGLAILCRQYLLAVPLFWSAAAATASVAGRSTVARRQVLTYLVGVVLLPGLWIARNHHFLGAPVISTETDVFWYGNNPLARGSNPGALWNPAHPMFEDLRQRYPGFPDRGEVSASQVYLKEAKDYVVRQLTTHPVHMVWLESRKVLITFLPFAPLFTHSWHRRAYFITYPIVGVLALLGFYLAIRDGGHGFQISLLGGPIVSVVLAVLVALGTDRYRFGIDPCLILFAAFAWDRLRAGGRHSASEPELSR